MYIFVCVLYNSIIIFIIIFQDQHTCLTRSVNYISQRRMTNDDDNGETRAFKRLAMQQHVKYTSTSSILGMSMC